MVMSSKREKMSVGQEGKLEVARRLRDLRLRGRLSMRDLAAQAGVAASYISGVERNLISPTIAMMRKMLNAMGSDLGSFFAPGPDKEKEYVFRRDEMRSVTDRKRTYTFVFPRRKDMKLEMLVEDYVPRERPQFETLSSELAGYVISGEFLLEMRGKSPQQLKSGDAFYVPVGTPVRGHCLKNCRARLITVQVPPNY
jgi:transcriptional regulator with XRE-family HTH domain